MYSETGAGPDDKTTARGEVKELEMWELVSQRIGKIIPRLHGTNNQWTTLQVEILLELFRLLLECRRIPQVAAKEIANRYAHVPELIGANMYPASPGSRIFQEILDDLANRPPDEEYQEILSSQLGSTDEFLDSQGNRFKVVMDRLMEAVYFRALKLTGLDSSTLYDLDYEERVRKVIKRK